MKKNLPAVDVGCAVIVREGRILIAQRSEGSHLAGHWEFPGRKREKKETIEACLVREAAEELAIRIEPTKPLAKKEHRYPDRTLLLYFFLCEWVSGEPEALECQKFAWVRPEELPQYKFPPADTEIIENLMREDLMF